MRQFPALALLGPRQVGKTTLARSIAADLDGVYFDLERPSDRLKLSDPELALGGLAHRLVVPMKCSARRACLKRCDR